MIEAIYLHFTVLNSLAELEQLRVQKFNSLMQSSPSIRKAFQHSSKITADFIQDFYPASFSPAGSNKRVLEEAVMMAWVRYLQGISGEYRVANS